MRLVSLRTALRAVAFVWGGIALAVPVGARADTYSCNAAGVAYFSKAGGGPRIHLRCDVATPQGVAYFAMGTKNKSESALVLGVLTEAVADNRPVTLFYDPADLSGAKIGCSNADCRLFQGIEVAP